VGQRFSKCREDQISCRVPAPDAGPRIEVSGKVDLMKGDDAPRPDEACGCMEEGDRISLMDQNVSANDAIKEMEVGKVVEWHIPENDLF
jgi:hypothetical protein